MTTKTMEQRLMDIIGKTNTKAGVRQISDGQVSLIHKLCDERKLTPDSLKMTNFEEADAYIKELLAVKNVTTTGTKKPISQAQIDRITQQCETLGIPTPDFDTLEGGYGGTASQKIQELSTLISTTDLPPSLAQLEFIEDMAVCPSITPLTADEISQLTKKSASEYINKNQAEYRVWVKNILSEDQMLNIVRLHCMIEGVDYEDVYANKEWSAKEKALALIPRQSMPYSGLVQITKEIAPKYIAELETELKAKAWAKTTLEPEEMRGIKTKEEVEPKSDPEYLAFDEAIRMLYMAMNQQPEDHFVDTFTMTDFKDLVFEATMMGVPVKKILDNVECLQDYL